MGGLCTETGRISKLGLSLVQAVSGCPQLGCVLCRVTRGNQALRAGQPVGGVGVLAYLHLTQQYVPDLVMSWLRGGPALM